MSADAAERAKRVRLMLFDVDGVLTDGTLYLGPAGEAMKGFNVRDGHGLKLLAEAGIEVGFLSTRSSDIVRARARELGITLVLQGEAHKRTAFQALISERSLAPERCGYMGDDLLDLCVMVDCGFAATVPEASGAVRERAHYVSAARGGHGAAREVCEFILGAHGVLDEAVRRHLA
jgi:3-deoxy-D-manno-octulosonate 8-phosphate phosphatase (KDO 8-P phosphatase)